MKGLRPVGMVEPMSLWTLSNISHLLHLVYITVHLVLFHTSRRPVVFPPQNLWFANPGGSNSMPSRSHSSVQRTRSLPVHTSPQTMLMFQQPGRKQTFFFFCYPHLKRNECPRRGSSHRGALGQSTGRSEAGTEPDPIKRPSFPWGCTSPFSSSSEHGFSY